MNPEVLFMQALKGLGLDRARYLFSLVESYEGAHAEVEIPALPEKETKFLTALGAKVMELAPPPKKSGRPIDPNSNFQRVKACLLSYLEKHKQAKTEDIYTAVVQATGLSLAVCKTNAVQVKGITRNYGVWSLAPIG
jgi:hypothetical protein